VLGLVHILIDTRVPVDFWMRRVKRCPPGSQAEWIALGLDQTLHILSIAAWLAFAGA
jgi:hypothetical protein